MSEDKRGGKKANSANADTTRGGTGRRKTTQHATERSSGRSDTERRGKSTTTRTGARTRHNDTGHTPQRTSTPRASKNPHKSTTKNTASRNANPPTPPHKTHHVFRTILLLVLILIAACFGWLAYEYSKLRIPEPDAFALAQPSRAYYSDGVTEIGALSAENRTVIDCSTLPNYVGNAIVASENRTFWTDSGIDLKGIARAVFLNATTGSRQGGSTITQQYAERYYLGQTDTYEGKVREALLAVKIARTQSKETVLCNYMNTIYFGRGAYGIEEASQRYFGIPASQMTMPQAALIAGIIPAPSAWDPAVNLTQAQKRFMRVIAIMREDGYISAQDANTALMPDTIAPTAGGGALDWSGPNGYLLAMISAELTSTGALDAVDVAQGGYTVTTTLDTGVQATMNSVAARETGGLNMPDGVEVGGMCAEPSSGAILAAWGGEDYAAKQLNNATQAVYEPGSTMKAFALVAASRAGISLTDDLFDGNSPKSFPDLATPVSNAGGKSWGMINLTEATAKSSNTAFVELTERVGAASVAQAARDAGISTDLSDNTPFITLGIDAVTVRDMTQAYATLAAGGARTQLHAVTRVTGPAGNTVYEAKFETTQTIDEADATNATDAMKTVMQQGGTAGSVGASLAAAGKDTSALAGKTGTANDLTARSITGYTPGMVTTFAVWNPGADGSAQALPAWNGYEACEGLPNTLFARFMVQALP